MMRFFDSAWSTVLLFVIFGGVTAFVVHREHRLHPPQQVAFAFCTTEPCLRAMMSTMSLSDCERCWDTPCRCGNDGYVVLYPGTADLRARLKSLEPQECSDIQTKLRLLLDEMLAEKSSR